MKYRRINNSYKKISVLGLGTWSLSNREQKKYFYKKISLKNIKEILDSSYEKGVNFYDTSPAYGESEKILGSVFKTKRDDIIFSTKIGLTKFGEKIDFSINKIEKQIHKSLRNLKTDHIDILFFYTPKFNNYKILKSFEFVKKFKDKGIISQIGVSVKSPFDILKISDEIKFDSVQCNFNILDNRLYNKKILSFVKKTKMDIFARTILGLGFFTEKINRNNLKFHKSDIRNSWDNEQIKLWKKGIKKIKENDNENLNIENIAIKFVLAEKMIKSSLIGIQSSKELNNNFAQSNLKKLNKKLFEYIKNLNKINNFFIKKQVQNIKQ